MRNEPFLSRAAATWLAAALLAGCAAPAPPVAPGPASTQPAGAPTMNAMELPEPAPARPALPPEPPAPGSAKLRDVPVETVLAYADRVRALPQAELAQEIQRLGLTTYSPARALQLALALAQSRTAPNVQRAQSLLQRVLGQTEPDAAVLHPLARLLAAQLADQRRADEQAERQGHQLREAQRRIDQLNERLEAVRAIERSVPTRPHNDVPAPRPPARTHTP